MTPAETYVAYEALNTKIERHDYAGLDELHELKKQRDEAMRNIIPEAGRGCTEILFSDRRACTITRVFTPKKIAVRHNRYKVVDWEQGKCKVFPELEGDEMIFTKRRNGWWVEEGQPTSQYSVLLMLHYQHTYIDPHF